MDTRSLHRPKAEALCKLAQQLFEESMCIVYTAVVVVASNM